MLPRNKTPSAWSLALLALSLLTPLVSSALADADPPAATEAVSSEPAAPRASIADLPDLTGHWRGEGWIRRGSGEPERFVSEETVWEELDGEILLVRGEHWTPGKSRRVHHAFAMLTPGDDRIGADYRFATYVVGMGGGDFPARLVNDKTIVWSMETPGGLIEYTITLDGDTWREVGRMRRGDRWVEFFEMKLGRVSR